MEQFFEENSAWVENYPEVFTKGTYDFVKRRTLSGGKFAVTSVKREDKEDIGDGIMLAWKRFGEWLCVRKYTWGGNQYLEEHAQLFAYANQIYELLQDEFVADKYDLDAIDQAENQQEVISDLLSFVTDWLVEHILNLDTQIGK